MAAKQAIADFHTVVPLSTIQNNWTTAYILSYATLMTNKLPSDLRPTIIMSNALRITTWVVPSNQWNLMPGLT
jgi:hypothetical protein